jgi:steroid delta-isomerase-like uncharacterized protein
MSHREAENKALVRRFLDASVVADQAAFKEMMAPDFVALVNGRQDRQTFLQSIGVFTAAFSDQQFTVEDLIAEGDRVVARATWRGIHTGTFRGLPPTGKTIEVSAILVERIRDGQVVEHWSLFDNLSMLQQLGLIPAPEQAER